MKGYKNFADLSKKDKTRIINNLQQKYPGTRRQRSYHGCGHYSVQFFDKKTGQLVADFDL